VPVGRSGLRSDRDAGVVQTDQCRSEGRGSSAGQVVRLAVGPAGVRRAVGAIVDRAVVSHEVVGPGRPTGGPVLNMMSVAVAWLAAGEAAVGVAGLWRSVVRALKTVPAILSKVSAKDQFTLQLKSTSKLPAIGDEPAAVPDSVVDWYSRYVADLVRA